MPSAKKQKTAAAEPPALQRLRKICLSLPNTRETLSWGSPHFRVGVTPRMNWKQVKAFVEESYRLIAPKARKAQST